MTPPVCSHVYTPVRFTPKAHGRMRTFSLVRVCHKLKRVSHLRLRQLRCHCLLLCCLQGQLKAHAVTIAKTTAAKTKSDCVQRSHLLDSKIVQHHSPIQIYRLRKNAQEVSTFFVVKFAHVSAMRRHFLNVRSTYMLHNQEAPASVYVLQ